MSSPGSRSYNLSRNSQSQNTFTRYSDTGAITESYTRWDLVRNDKLDKVAMRTANWKTLIRQGSRRPFNAYYVQTLTTIGQREGDAYSAMGAQTRYETQLVSYTPHRITGAVTNPIYKKFLVTQDSLYSYWFYTPDVMLIPNLAPHIERARVLAVQKLLSKIKDQKANLAQAYMESAQVHRMIGGATVKIAAALVFLRKGQLGNAAQEFGLNVSRRQATRYRKAMSRAKDPNAVENTLAQGVLAIQYGIRPLLSDITGAAELYAQKVTREVVATAKASHVHFFEESRSKSFSSNYNAYGPYKGVAQCKTSGRITVKYQCSFSKGSEVHHTLKQMGMTNPFLLGWELLPWSFVIDWFIPIGEWLSNLDAALGLDYLDGGYSVLIDVSHQRRQVVTGHVETSSKSSVSVKSFQRIPLSGFPSTSFPTFKNPASWEHALNGVALLVGLKSKLAKF